MNLRLDVPLLEQLAASAQHEVRSVNGEIVARLRASFRQQDRATAAEAAA
jgi:hypothetical protein